MSEGVSCVQVDIVPDAGHFVFLESPTAFLDKFRTQLREYMYNCSPGEPEAQRSAAKPAPEYHQPWPKGAMG